MKCFEVLGQEHQLLLRMLNLLKRIGSKGKNGLKLDRREVKSTADLFVTLLDQVHDLKEEAALFPILMNDAGPELTREIQARVFEHDRERSLLEGMQESLLCFQPDDFAYYASHLSQLFQGHVLFESKLFSDCEALLTPEVDESIMREFLRLDPVQTSRRNDIRRSLKPLEVRYRSDLKAA